MAHKDPQELYEEFFIKERNICLELIRKYEISSKTFKECAIPDTVKRLHEMDVTLSKMDEQITSNYWCRSLYRNCYCNFL